MFEDEQQQQQSENPANSGAAEERINELVGQIQALRQQLDQKSVIEKQEKDALQQQQEQAQQQTGVNPDSDDVRVWGPWMGPKIQQFLEPRDRVIVALADKIDELETVRKFPEYNDEEFQSAVTKFIRETKKNRGIVLSRVDAITHLKGLEVINQRASSANMQQQEEVQQQPSGGYRRVSSAVEIRPGASMTRAATQTQTKNPEDLSIEEFEKQYRDMKV